MRNIFMHFHVSLPSIFCGIAAMLAVVYVGLISVVMSYASLTVDFAQSIKDDEAVVATLESTYLTAIAHIHTSDYQALGYTVPGTKIFVPSESVTALR